MSRKLVAHGCFSKIYHLQKCENVSLTPLKGTHWGVLASVIMNL